MPHPRMPSILAPAGEPTENAPAELLKWFCMYGERLSERHEEKGLGNAHSSHSFAHSVFFDQLKAAKIHELFAWVRTNVSVGGHS